MKYREMSDYSGPKPQAQKPGSRNEYQYLYNSKRWAYLRRQQLSAHTRCVMCQAHGRMTPATVADHIIPHRGDSDLFHDPANLQSLCKACHDGAKQQYERTGVMRGCDVNGVPLDPGHAWRKAP